MEPDLNQSLDNEREMKEIIEAQRVIDEILVANSDAIKKLNGEIAKVQEQNYDEIIKTSSRVIEQRVVKKCRYFNRDHVDIGISANSIRQRIFANKNLDCGKFELKNCGD